MLQDATRRWRSSKAMKQTQTCRCKTFKCSKMLLEDEGDETRPRGCKYLTPLWRLLKYYPRRLCAPSFVKSRTLCPPQKHFLLFQRIFFVLVCIHPGTPMVPPLVLASGPKPCGGNWKLLWEISFLSISYKVCFTSYDSKQIKAKKWCVLFQHGQEQCSF